MNPTQAEGALMLVEKYCERRWNKTSEEIDEMIKELEETNIAIETSFDNIDRNLKLLKNRIKRL